jgi:hypothetical protein
MVQDEVLGRALQNPRHSSIPLPVLLVSRLRDVTTVQAVYPVDGKRNQQEIPWDGGGIGARDAIEKP